MKPPHVAVLVRAQAVTDKLRNLLDVLKTGLGYAVFVSADETDGPMLLEGTLMLRHSPARCAALGLVAELPDTPLLWFFGDYALYCARAEIPGYDHYLLLDGNLGLVRDNPLFIEGVVRRLGDAAEGYDLLAGGLGTRAPEWVWHAAAAAHFPTVHGIAAPLVALSHRAVDHLLAWRRREASLPEGGRPVFWEALVPSALMAEGSFRCADLNSLFPGAWSPASFPAPAPMLLGSLPPFDPRVEMVYPVLAERQYLAWLLAESRRTGKLAEMVGRLAPGGEINVSQPARDYFLREALLSMA